MQIILYNKWCILNKKLRQTLKVKTRKERKTLWQTIKETVNNDNTSYNIFIEYRVRPYEIEITEIFKEKMAIEKIKPYLINYINWRLYNPTDGLRFLKALEIWKRRL